MSAAMYTPMFGTHSDAALVDAAAGGRSPFSFDVRMAPVRPSHAVYVRRRLAVALTFAALLAVLGLTAQSVLADRGGVPASTSAIQPAAQPITQPVGAVAQLAAATYIVQPGDTLWSIAGAIRGDSSLADYVDSLVSINGGTSLQPGQVISLP